MAGVAVIGCAGGVGTTLIASALALAGAARAAESARAAVPAGGQGVRVLGLDGHGGGPHVFWGLAPDRGVDHLQAVRAEVDASHVDHLVHRHRWGVEVVAGPCDAVATAAWGDHAEGLLAALTERAQWVADLGRGDHCLAVAAAARATVAVLVTAAAPSSLEACARHADRLPPMCRALPVLVRRRDESLSVRGARRLLGRDVLEMPWDRAGAERCAAAADPGTRGLWKVIADMRGEVMVDA